MHDIAKVLNEKGKTKKLSNKNILTSKVIQNWRSSFPDKQKLEEFIITKPALQEMLDFFKLKIKGTN